MISEGRQQECISLSLQHQGAVSSLHVWDSVKTKGKPKGRKQLLNAQLLPAEARGKHVQLLISSSHAATERLVKHVTGRRYGVQSVPKAFCYPVLSLTSLWRPLVATSDATKTQTSTDRNVWESSKRCHAHIQTFNMSVSTSRPFLKSRPRPFLRPVFCFLGSCLVFSSIMNLQQGQRPGELWETEHWQRHKILLSGTNWTS